jgi:hypothetical protein
MVSLIPTNLKIHLGSLVPKLAKLAKPKMIGESALSLKKFRGWFRSLCTVPILLDLLDDLKSLM